MALIITCICVCARQVTRQLAGIGSLLPPLGLRNTTKDQTQIVRHCAKCLYLLSHITGPASVFLIALEDSDSVTQN